MATTTSNYGLVKPSGSENADISVINSNMDTIDAELKAQQTELDSKASSSDIPDVSEYVKAVDAVGIEDTVPATFDGHPIEDFVLQSDADQFATTTDVETLETTVSGKVAKAGDTMTGALVAQTNTNYTTAQVRNVIISTSDPSGGSSGDIWIKYTA